MLKARSMQFQTLLNWMSCSFFGCFALLQSTHVARRTKFTVTPFSRRYRRTATLRIASATPLIQIRQTASTLRNEYFFIRALYTRVIHQAY